MSGIAGIYNFDGAPVSADLLEAMTSSLSGRGPDRQGVWRGKNVGLGHALLRTCADTENDQQPLTLDGHSWLVADARIDGRSELIGKLQAGGVGPRDSASDAGLILRAWQRWGEQCVGRLYGDFAFAIWDEPRQVLFCARDHMGVKPFYYAFRHGSFVFGNTLHSLRVHPEVTGDLNPLAIADYLLFGFRQDPAATCFRDIQRLPAAHTLLISADGFAVRPYWQLTPGQEIRWRDERNYLERFQELLHQAVADRIRTDRVAVFMSGGLDSTSVAAVAREALAGSGTMAAFTVVDELSGEDSERHFSGIVAAALDIPIRYLAADHYRPFERWEDEAVRGLEPGCTPLAAISCDQFRQVEEFSRVALTGDGGDYVLYPARRYFFDLLRRGRLPTLTVDAWRCVRTLGRIPRFGFRAGLREYLRPSAEAPPPMPEWLNPDLVRTLDLEQRWRRFHAPKAKIGSRPEAIERLTHPSLANEFELNDPGMTFTTVEVRCPLFDVRLMEYLLAIPPVPWNFDKGILRLAMRGRLPEAVRQRPKTPLATDLLSSRIGLPECTFVDDFKPHSQLAQFVDRSRIPRLREDPESVDVWTHIRPLCLDFWLNSMDTSGTLTMTRPLEERT